eukprot:1170833-Alexandrium_andersonii.AAC.1
MAGCALSLCSRRFQMYALAILRVSALVISALCFSAFGSVSCSGGGARAGLVDGARPCPSTRSSRYALPLP